MSNYSTGHLAEQKASEHLTELGFKILAVNWKTRVCEIDIVAKKERRLYFVEVKHRRGDKYGRGLDYITTKKLSSMKFAAEVWVKDNGYSGDYQLAAIELQGSDYIITAFLEDL